MNRQTRTFIVVGVALVFASVASFAVYHAISQIPVREVPIATNFAVVANKSLPVGTMVKDDDVKVVAWPADSPVPGGFSKKEDVVGRGLMASVVENEPLTTAKLAPRESGAGLPPSIPPGMRAISVRVDESTGVAGLVYPGDRVDVILTHEVSIKSAEDERQRDRKVRVSETILTNVRVIAIDQSMDDLKVTKGDVTKSRIPKTATLEVNTNQAEVVAVAIKMGTLHLAVRSLACGGTETQAASTGETPNCSEARALTNDAERGKTYTADSDVSRMKDRPDANTMQVYVLRGNDKPKKSDSTVTVKLPTEPTEPSLPNQ